MCSACLHTSHDNQRTCDLVALSVTDFETWFIGIQAIVQLLQQLQQQQQQQQPTRGLPPLQIPTYSADVSSKLSVSHTASTYNGCDDVCVHVYVHVCVYICAL